MPAIAAAGVLGVVVVAGLAGNGSGDAASGSTPSAPIGSGPQVTGTSTGDTDGNPGALDVTLTVPGVTQPNVVVETTTAPVQKTALSQPIAKGSYGEDVKRLQQRLTDLGFAPGPVDGAFGSGTQQAVWAYKKLVMGMRWQDLDASNNATTVTADMWSAMQDPIAIQPRRQQPAGRTHVEIYLPQQVMIVFESNQPKLIAHISSGDDQEWCDTLSYDTDEYGQPLEERRISEECGRSYTPGGVFKFYRRHEGRRESALGGMYNPVYFNYGIAVHGAQNVPTSPASHGCIRISMDISEYFPSLVDNGDLVYVWGQNGKEPEHNSSREQKPVFNWKNPDATTTTSSTSTTTTVAPTTTAATETTAKPSATTTPPVTTAAPNTTAAPVVTTAAPATTAAANTTVAPNPTVAPGP